MIRGVVGTKKQAEQVERKLRTEIAEWKLDIRSTEDVSFPNLVKEYLRYAKINKAASTFSIDSYRIKAHLLPYFGDVLLREITPQMVDNYKSMRVEEGMSPKTVNRELTDLSHMLKMAVRWGYITRTALEMSGKTSALPYLAKDFLLCQLSALII